MILNMNGHCGHHTEVGETLPLFENVGNNAVPSKAEGGQLPRRNAPKADSNSHDRHMQAAWQLSKALKAAKNGRKAGRDVNKLTPVQKHQVGNAICEHLLASLRAQVKSEQSQPQHH